MISEVLLKSLLSVLSALLGSLLIFGIKLDHKKLCALISFSAGALLGAAAFTLLPESFEFLGIPEIIIGTASGYFLFYFISKYYSHVCPACSASHFDERTTHKFSEIVLTLLTALSIHSLLDGMAISSFTDGHGHNHSVFAAITVHKFPEGLALASLMFSSGYKKGKIILYVVLVELTTIIGAVLGYYIFPSISPSVLGAITAHISGGFIYLAVHAVLGELYRHHKGLVIGSFAIGLLLILGVNLFIG